MRCSKNSWFCLIRKLSSDFVRQTCTHNFYKAINMFFIMGEEKQATLGGEKKPYDKTRDFQNVMDRQGGYGRLKAVSKTRNPVKCRVCKKDIVPGSSCYMHG